MPGPPTAGGTFSSTTALSPTWVAPGVSSSTNVTLTLTVNDGTVSTAATATVTVNPLPAAITSVTARSVGPERVQIIANLEVHKQHHGDQLPLPGYLAARGLDDRLSERLRQ